MDADQLLESYLGGKVPTPKGTDTPMTGDDYLKSYLSSTPTAAISADVKRVNIDTTPKPPISGATAEQSADINAQPSQSGGENPRRYSSPSKLVGDVATGASELPGDIARSTGEAARTGIETFKSGAQDVIENRPATGVGKMALGAAGYVASPVTGALKEVVEKPVTNLTGSERAGEAAGFVAGAALPVAKIGGAVNAARPVNKAFNQLIDLVGKENLPTFIAELKSNPRLSPMDVNNSVQQAAQKLVVTEGPHQNLMKNVVEQRLNSAKGAVGDIVSDTMGGPIDLKNTVDRLKAKARETGKTLINPVVAKTPIVDITDLVNGIDKEIGKPLLNSIRKGTVTPAVSPLQTELLKVRKEIRGEWPDRDQMAHYTDDLHDVQSRLRVRAERLIKNGGSDANLGHDLMDVRNKIVDAIDKGTNSEYKPALKQYRDDMHVQDAFEKGETVLQNRSTKREDDPSYWKHWVEKEATADELAAAKEGARMAVDRQINGMRNAVGQKGTEIPQVEFNKSKLKYLFGDAEVEAMSAKLQHERQIADTNKKLFEGSQTPQRLKAHSAVDLPEASNVMKSLPVMAAGEVASTLSGGPFGASTGAILGLKGAAKLYDVAKLSHAKAKNVELAKLATATGPEKDALIQALSDVISPPKQSLLSRSGNALSRVIGP